MGAAGPRKRAISARPLAGTAKLTYRLFGVACDGWLKMSNIMYYANLAAAAHQRIVISAPAFPFAIPRGNCRGDGNA
jgi:hypothetical protein